MIYLEIFLPSFLSLLIELLRIEQQGFMYKSEKLLHIQ